MSGENCSNEGINSVETETDLFLQRKSARLKKMSLKDYLNAELTRGYVMDVEEERYAARREKIYTFMTIPCELEKLMGFGFFQCADAFLFIFTFLPLRCLFALYNLGKRFITSPELSSGIRIKSADRCDLLKIFILSSCVYGFSYIDTSVLYHIVKSQSVIKLYIFFNMLEVGDRLFASFVQDTLDALFLTAIEKSENKRSKMGITAHIILALGSVFLHALVILLQGTTLSVAINSSNRSLLTVMMSNNFVELKGSVFKKFDKINLFQVSCSDIRERFHLSVLLVIVCLQTMREYAWEESRFWVLFPDVLMVLIAEVFVDWLKHAFITRFNEIPADVYKEYTLSLAYDLAQTKQKRAFSDHSDMVGRKLGFVPLPLAIVLARIFRPILKDITFQTFFLILLGFIALASFRLLNSIILLGKACDLIEKHIKKISPKYALKIQDGQTINNNIEDISLQKIKRNNLRSAISQPTTRTPSPHRIHSIFNESNENIDELNAQLIDQIKTEGEQQPKGKFYRSYSASHTPRPSIVGIQDQDWKFQPSLPDSSQALLMSNSTVSILSVSLNEEMLRASKPDETEKKTKPPPKPARKHSLGAVTQAIENIQLNKDEIKVKQEKLDLTNKSESKENINLYEKDHVDVDLDKTIVPNDNKTLEENIVNKENLEIDAINPPQNNGLNLNDDGHDSVQSTLKQRKKKGFLTFLSH